MRKLRRGDREVPRHHGQLRPVRRHGCLHPGGGRVQRPGRLHGERDRGHAARRQRGGDHDRLLPGAGQGRPASHPHRHEQRQPRGRAADRGAPQGLRDGDVVQAEGAPAGGRFRRRGPDPARAWSSPSPSSASC
ncbi:hypothetical protein G5V59_08090 [Nocardioides sp. W3-2-3]|uniref:hypothetical protein n=1 Tax=Nocardioides convexus TaxID=2712224 RepID=UPI002418782A|nr:hypothetical protein [Nocardioides convexus]NHA00132.1 hypothetical protein [Nocardioides convexus]